MPQPLGPHEWAAMWPCAGRRPGKNPASAMSYRPRQNYYAILGVARTATAEEIRAAFRVQAKALHPDTNRQRNTKEEFQRIREAYSVLANAEKRRAYDSSERPSVSMDVPAHIPAEFVPPRARPKYTFAAVAIPVLAGVLLVYGIFGWEPEDASPAVSAPAAGDVEREMEVAASRYALMFTGPPTEPLTYEVIGREGKKSAVSAADYKRLSPLYERLASESRDLHRRKTNLDVRRAELEKEQAALLPTNVDGVLEFRRKVDAFNHDGAALRRHSEAHATEVEDYFKQVEALAEKER
jgi:curved DNA-binding protein CbpA